MKSYLRTSILGFAAGLAIAATAHADPQPKFSDVGIVVTVYADPDNDCWFVQTKESRKNGTWYAALIHRGPQGESIPDDEYHQGLVLMSTLLFNNDANEHPVRLYVLRTATECPVPFAPPGSFPYLIEPIPGYH